MESLSARKVATIKTPGRYGDGLNLWLQVAKGGTKSWIFRYATGEKKQSKKGKPYAIVREMGLGPFPDVSLVAARAAAAANRALLRQRIDPIRDRDNRVAEMRLAASKRVSFSEIATEYIEAKGAGWKNPKHKAQWQSTLKNDAKLLWGLPINAIDTQVVLAALRPIWREKPETASRLRGRIERVLAYAAVNGDRTGENPARWHGHLKEMLPERSEFAPVKHHAALPYSEMPAFMAELRNRKSVSARALEFCILTATRTNEVIGARLTEFDLKNKIWVIDGSRMKGKRQHRVPLSERAVAILRSTPREEDNPFAFIGGRSGRGLSDMAMLETLREMRTGITVHGTARATFKTWCGEETNFPREIVEAALAHRNKDKTEEAYERGDKLKRRRKLMDAWARYCRTPPRAKRRRHAKAKKAAN